MQKYPNNGAGKFNGFGGKLEAGESLEEGALRELRDWVLEYYALIHFLVLGSYSSYLYLKP